MTGRENIARKQNTCRGRKGQCQERELRVGERKKHERKVGFGGRGRRESKISKKSEATHGGKALTGWGRVQH